MLQTIKLVDFPTALLPWLQEMVSDADRLPKKRGFNSGVVWYHGNAKAAFYVYFTKSGTIVIRGDRDAHAKSRES